MEFKGTKGEWFIVKGEVNSIGECICIADKKESKGIEKLICVISDVTSFNETDLANAQIIRKSPKMFEILKKVLTDINEGKYPEGEWIYNELEQLIKEATTI